MTNQQPFMQPIIQSGNSGQAVSSLTIFNPPASQIEQQTSSKLAPINLEQHPFFLLRRQRPLLSNYNVIPDEKRFRLIEMVVNRHMRVKEASQILNINYQTAKSILRRFNKAGAIYR